MIDATRRLNAGDFAGAERALDAVPASHAAASDAAQVRNALERAMATRASTSAAIRNDNVPFDVAQSSLSLADWISTRVQLGATTEALMLRGTKRLTAVAALGSLRVRAGDAHVDVAADLGGRFWSDTGRFVIGAVSGELFPTGTLRWRLGYSRDEELGNLASAEWHILRDSGYVNVELKNWHRLNVTARVEGTHYSDDNLTLLAYAWATYGLAFASARAEIGYSAAYRDTRESRWGSVTGYFPYITPLGAVRHGPSASLAFRERWFEIGAAGGMALVATEVDPTTHGYFYSRRETQYYEGRVHLRLGSDEAAILAAYEVLQDGYYYTLRTTRVSAFLSF